MARHRSFTFGLLIAAAVSSPASAGAQETAAPPGENGLRIGAGRLHLSLEVEGRFDSNVLFYANAGRTPDLILHVRPGLALNVPGPSVRVDLAANLDWNKYLGVSGNTSGLTHLFGGATLGLGASREGMIGLDLSDAFRRSDETVSLSIGNAVVSDYNDLKLHFPIRPGRGALLLELGGEWTLESFEPFSDIEACNPARNASCDPNQISRFGYNQYQGDLSARWLFLPRTAIVVDASYFARAPRDTAVSKALSGLKAMSGLAGQVTPHIAATLKAGYGDTFASAGTPYRTWLANVELEYLLSELASARVGYDHSYAADPVTEFSLYGVHRVYGEGKILLGGRLAVHAQAEWDALDYVLTDGSSHLVRFQPGVDLEVQRWMVLGAGYALTYRTSGGTAAGIPAFSFTKNEVWLKVTVTY